MMKRRDFTTGLLAGGAAFLTIRPGPGRAATDWPGQPITLVIMYAQGGGTDTIMRTLAQEMASAKGWTINSINKPGAIGALATDFVAGKPSDGYNILGAGNYNKFLRVMGNPLRPAWEDWTIFQAANAIGSWAVPANSDFETFEDVVAYAKENPGALTMSTSGTGGVWHELGLIVSNAAGIEISYVSYKGGKEATLAGLQGETDIAGGGVHEHIDLIRAGRLRSLQQTSASDITLEDGTVLRSIGSILPQLQPILPLAAQFNMMMKRDTPLPILREVKDAFLTAVSSAAFREIVEDQYYEIDIRTGVEADRRAAQLETIAAATFNRYSDQIGVELVTAETLSLPRPEAFDSWWPPEGYEPQDL